MKNQKEANTHSSSSSSSSNANNNQSHHVVQTLLDGRTPHPVGMLLLALLESRCLSNRAQQVRDEPRQGCPPRRRRHHRCLGDNRLVAAVAEAEGRCIVGIGRCLPQIRAHTLALPHHALLTPARTQAPEALLETTLPSPPMPATAVKAAEAFGVHLCVQTCTILPTQKEGKGLWQQEASMSLEATRTNVCPKDAPSSTQRERREGGLQC